MISINEFRRIQLTTPKPTSLQQVHLAPHAPLSACRMRRTPAFQEHQKAGGEPTLLSIISFHIHVYNVIYMYV